MASCDFTTNNRRWPLIIHKFVYTLQKSGVLCDVKLVSIEGIAVPVHSIILASSSYHLYDCLRKSPGGFYSINVSVPHGILSKVVDYIYTGDLCVNDKQWADVMKCARLLQLDDLRHNLLRWRDPLMGFSEQRDNSDVEGRELVGSDGEELPADGEELSCRRRRQFKSGKAPVVMVDEGQQTNESFCRKSLAQSNAATQVTPCNLSLLGEYQSNDTSALDAVPNLDTNPSSHRTASATIITSSAASSSSCTSTALSDTYPSVCTSLSSGATSSQRLTTSGASVQTSTSETEDKACGSLSRITESSKYSYKARTIGDNVVELIDDSDGDIEVLDLPGLVISKEQGLKGSNQDYMASVENKQPLQDCESRNALCSDKSNSSVSCTTEQSVPVVQTSASSSTTVQCSSNVQSSTTEQSIAAEQLLQAVPPGILTPPLEPSPCEQNLTEGKQPERPQITHMSEKNHQDIEQEDLTQGSTCKETSDDPTALSQKCEKLIKLLEGVLNKDDLPRKLKRKREPSEEAGNESPTIQSTPAVGQDISAHTYVNQPVSHAPEHCEPVISKTNSYQLNSVNHGADNQVHSTNPSWHQSSMNSHVAHEQMACPRSQAELSNIGSLSGNVASGRRPNTSFSQEHQQYHNTGQLGTERQPNMSMGQQSMSMGTATDASNNKRSKKFNGPVYQQFQMSASQNMDLLRAQNYPQHANYSNILSHRFIQPAPVCNQTNSTASMHPMYSQPPAAMPRVAPQDSSMVRPVHPSGMYPQQANPSLHNWNNAAQMQNPALLNAQYSSFANGKNSPDSCWEEYLSRLPNKSGDTAVKKRKKLGSTRQPAQSKPIQPTALQRPEVTQPPSQLMLNRTKLNPQLSANVTWHAHQYNAGVAQQSQQSNVEIPRLPHQYSAEVTRQPQRIRTEVTKQTQQLSTVVTQQLQPSSTLVTQQFQPSSTLVTQQLQPSSTLVTQQLQPSSTLVTQQLQPSSALVTQQLQPSSTLVTQQLQPSSALVTQQLQPSSALVTQQLQPSSALVTQQLQPSSALVTQQLQPSSAVLTQQLQPSSALVTQQLQPSSALVTQQLQPSSALVTQQLQPSSAVLTQQFQPLSAVLTQQLQPSSTVITQQPSAVITQQPSAVLTQQPSAVLNQQPQPLSAVVNQQLQPLSSVVTHKPQQLSTMVTSQSAHLIAERILKMATNSQATAVSLSSSVSSVVMSTRAVVDSSKSQQVPACLSSCEAELTTCANAQSASPTECTVNCADSNSQSAEHAVNSNSLPAEGTSSSTSPNHQPAKYRPLWRGKVRFSEAPEELQCSMAVFSDAPIIDTSKWPDTLRIGIFPPAILKSGVHLLKDGTKVFLKFTHESHLTLPSSLNSLVSRSMVGCVEMNDDKIKAIPFAGNIRGEFAGIIPADPESFLEIICRGFQISSSTADEKQGSPQSASADAEKLAESADSLASHRDSSTNGVDSDSRVSVTVDCSSTLPVHHQNQIESINSSAGSTQASTQVCDEETETVPIAGDGSLSSLVHDSTNSHEDLNTSADKSLASAQTCNEKTETVTIAGDGSVTSQAHDGENSLDGLNSSADKSQVAAQVCDVRTEKSPTRSFEPLTINSNAGALNDSFSDDEDDCDRLVIDEDCTEEVRDILQNKRVAHLSTVISVGSSNCYSPISDEDTQDSCVFTASVTQDSVNDATSNAAETDNGGTGNTAKASNTDVNFSSSSSYSFSYDMDKSPECDSGISKADTAEKSAMETAKVLEDCLDTIEICIGCVEETTDTGKVTPGAAKQHTDVVEPTPDASESPSDEVLNHKQVPDNDECISDTRSCPGSDHPVCSDKEIPDESDDTVEDPGDERGSPVNNGEVAMTDMSDASSTDEMSDADKACSVSACLVPSDLKASSQVVSTGDDCVDSSVNEPLTYVTVHKLHEVSASPLEVQKSHCTEPEVPFASEMGGKPILGTVEVVLDHDNCDVTELASGAEFTPVTAEIPAVETIEMNVPDQTSDADGPPSAPSADGPLSPASDEDLSAEGIAAADADIDLYADRASDVHVSFDDDENFWESDDSGGESPRTLLDRHFSDALISTEVRGCPERSGFTSYCSKGGSARPSLEISGITNCSENKGFRTLPETLNNSSSVTGEHSGKARELPSKEISSKSESSEKESFQDLHQRKSDFSVKESSRKPQPSIGEISVVDDQKDSHSQSKVISLCGSFQGSFSRSESSKETGRKQSPHDKVNLSRLKDSTVENLSEKIATETCINVKHSGKENKSSDSWKRPCPFGDSKDVKNKKIKTESTTALNDTKPAGVPLLKNVTVNIKRLPFTYSREGSRKLEEGLKLESSRNRSDREQKTSPDKRKSPDHRIRSRHSEARSEGHGHYFERRDRIRDHYHSTSYSHRHRGDYRGYHHHDSRRDYRHRRGDEERHSDRRYRHDSRPHSHSDRMYLDEDYHAHRPKRVRFVGRYMKHMWIEDDGSQKWYYGQVLEAYGPDGISGTEYEVMYLGEDTPFQVNHLLEDYNEGSVIFLSASEYPLYR